MNPWPDLRPILQGIDWAIVGGVATRAYMPERMTKDIDILVHQKDGEAALAKLQQAGYQVISPLSISGYLLHSPEGIEVDLIFGKDAWLKKALAHPGQDPAGCQRAAALARCKLSETSVPRRQMASSHQKKQTI